MVFQHGQEFCDLQDRYWNDTTFGVEDVFDHLTAISTPDQMRQVARWIDDRKAQGWGPVTRDEAYPAIAVRPKMVFAVRPEGVSYQVPARAIAEVSPAGHAAQSWLGGGGEQVAGT